MYAILTIETIAAVISILFASVGRKATLNSNVATSMLYRAYLFELRRTSLPDSFSLNCILYLLLLMTLLRMSLGRCGNYRRYSVSNTISHCLLMHLSSKIVMKTKFGALLLFVTSHMVHRPKAHRDSTSIDWHTLQGMQAT